MEIDEEYIDKVKSLIEQKDAENVKTLLTDLHPALGARYKKVSTLSF